LIRDEIAAIHLTKGLLAILADEAVRNLLDKQAAYQTYFSLPRIRRLPPSLELSTVLGNSK
jgi:hypothetical protein